MRLAATWWGRSQFWSGPLDEKGAPPPDCAAFDRLYNVSRTDIEEYETTGVAAPDLYDWPTGLGAPTLAPPGNRLDDDGDGDVDEANEELLFDITVPLAERKYRVIDLAAGERPAILGDQSIWWIMNDRGNERPQIVGSRTPPIGLEVHAMAFAFNVGGDVGNTTFYKYNLYLHGSTPLDNAYSAFLVDPDLGSYWDDWIGSDTVRGMGFAWNADNDDEGGNGYGSPAPAVGFDFVQGPIVPSKGDTAVVSGVQHPNYRNLQMAHLRPEWDWPGEFGARPNDLFYMFMRGRWWDGRPLTVGGNGRDFSDEPIDFMFPGDPGYSDAECHYWSQCNWDGAGTDYRSHDQRFVMSTGPFTLEPLELQHVVFAIVWAQGLNNFDSVQRLKKANDLVQSLHDANYQKPSPPDAPDVTATPMDQEVLLEWSSAPTSNNFLESYTVIDPFARLDANEYAFEGYEVIQYENELDKIGQTIAVYDVPNGVQRVIEASPRGLERITATGTDRGVQTHHAVTGLTNYKTYYFGVQAYAYNEASTPKIFRGPIQHVEVIPTRPVSEISDLALAALANGSAPDFVFENHGVGDGTVTANIVNPRSLKEAIYTVEFYDVEGVALAGVAEDVGMLDPRVEQVRAKQHRVETVTFNIRRNGAVVFDGSVIGQPAPSWPNTGLYLDGLQFSIVSQGAGFRDFLVTANALGALDPPESAILGGLGFPDPQDLGGGTIGRQQSTASVRWGLNAGGSESGLYGSVEEATSFLGRVLRLGDNLVALGGHDYEMRFTQRCADGINGITEPADCLALRPFGQSPPVMEVPFELWDAGIKTPNDPSDDVRLVPAICDTALCGGGRMDGAFDIGGDHPASDGADDPLSDWVYFYRTEDISPGESGYARTGMTAAAWRKPWRGSCSYWKMAARSHRTCRHGLKWGRSFVSRRQSRFSRATCLRRLPWGTESRRRTWRHPGSGCKTLVLCRTHTRERPATR